MKANVTFNQIATELVNIFSNEARVTEYNAQSGTIRQGVCGWCGIMSPLNRLAFVEDFGSQTVTLAEVEARRRMADKAKEYAATNHAAHVAEANQNEQRNAAPVAGSFVWAVETGLKNEGQGMAGVIADAVEGNDVRRRLVCVERVINATAAGIPAAADAPEAAAPSPTPQPARKPRQRKAKAAQQPASSPVSGCTTSDTDEDTPAVADDQPNDILATLRSIFVELLVTTVCTLIFWFSLSHASLLGAAIAIGMLAVASRMGLTPIMTAAALEG